MAHFTRKGGVRTYKTKSHGMTVVKRTRVKTTRVQKKKNG